MTGRHRGWAFQVVAAWGRDVGETIDLLEQLAPAEIRATLKRYSADQDATGKTRAKQLLIRGFRVRSPGGPPLSCVTSGDPLHGHREGSGAGIFFEVDETIAVRILETEHRRLSRKVQDRVIGQRRTNRAELLVGRVGTDRP
jgi:hypothetical protein